jgi:Recombinase
VDCVHGMIRVPRRPNATRRDRRKTTQIPRELAEILDAWWSIRREGKPDRRTHLRYGEKFTDDRRDRIPDDAEQAVIADMQRWRGEGWSYKRIAEELTRQGIPTKKGKEKWIGSSVLTILEKGGRPYSDEGATTREDDGKRSGSEGEPDWVFPNTSGKGNWLGLGLRGYTAFDQLRNAGKAVGIEELNFESLRRFYHENRRVETTLELGWDKASSGPDIPPSSPVELSSGPRGSATDRDISTDQAASISQANPSASPKPRPTWPPGRCPVSFGADGLPIVAGQPKKVTRHQLKVIRALHDAGPDGLTGEELRIKSGCGGFRNILMTLAKDEDWDSRIRLAEVPHGRYRFAMPGYK